MKKLLSCLFVALALTFVYISPAHADPYDFTNLSVNEFPVTTAAPASGDYDFRWVASANRVEKISATALTLSGAFNGTVGATTPSTGVFTGLTVGASGTFDLSPTFSSGITANPVTHVLVGSATVAQVNAGLTILAATAGRKIYVTNYDLVASGTPATCTGVYLEDTAGTPVVVATVPVADLSSGTHAIPLASVLGAGFGSGGLTSGDGLQLIVDGSSCTTMTSLAYEITYTLQ